MEMFLRVKDRWFWLKLQMAIDLYKYLDYTYGPQQLNVILELDNQV